MRADIIIILPPFLDDVPSVSEAPEDLLIQAFIADLPVHAFRVYAPNIFPSLLEATNIFLVEVGTSLVASRSNGIKEAFSTSTA